MIRPQRPLQFWVRSWRTKPISENALDMRLGLRGFNGQSLRASILCETMRTLGCTAFVETGTRVGETAAFVNRACSLPVYTCELDTVSYWKARLNLLPLRRVKVFHANSAEFLAGLLEREDLGLAPAFYLDAHWNDYLPLSDELRILSNSLLHGLVVIDDVRVDGAAFGYDSYDGVDLDLGLIREALGDRSDIVIYQPAYGPDSEARGRARGYAVLLIGEQQALPSRAPFDLLKRT